MAIDLKNFLPRSMKNDFWNDFMDSITEELQLLSTTIEEKRVLFNIEEQNDETQLAEISETFGNFLDRTIDGSVEYLKRDLYAITQKIKNKSTYNAYDYLFRTILYLGGVYNLSYDLSKLIKNIDYTNTWAVLNDVGFDPAAPFVSVIPDFYYDVLVADLKTLDTGETLDIGNTLDSDSVLQVTKHLAIEYFVQALLVVDSVDYILTKEYFSFLENAIIYNKKNTEVGHGGVQLAPVMDETGYFDSLSSSTYSTDDLKLNAATTLLYSSDAIAQINLDDGFNIDSAETWNLDKADHTNKTLEERFCYLVAGTGSKTMLSTTYSGLNSNIIGYWAFDKEFSSLAYDFSKNKNNGTLIGDYVRAEEGIINRCVEYNGLNTGMNVSAMTINDGDNLTISFWLKGLSADQLENPQYLFVIGDKTLVSTSIAFKSTNTQLDVYLTGSAGSGSQLVLTDSSFSLDNLDTLIMLEINKATNTANLYRNNSLSDTGSTASIGTLEINSQLNVGYRNDSGNEGWFKGLIDEVRIYSELLSAPEKAYYYSSMIGALGSLDNKIYRTQISADEINDTDALWRIISSNIEGNTVKGKVLEVSDGTTNNYSGTLDIKNIIEKSIFIEYVLNGVVVELRDDEETNILSTNFTGTVDYITGVYELLFYKDYTISQESLSTISVTGLSQNLDNAGILLNTFEIVYNIGDVTYLGSSDGAGTITGTGITSGTINALGALSITFSSATKVNQTIYCNYSYRVEALPDSGTNILISYRTNDQLEITEMGIENSDNNLVAYSTFPIVQFNNYKDNLGAVFIIKKTP